MKKGLRRDLQMRMACSRARIRELKKAARYVQRDYDGHSSEEPWPKLGSCRSRGEPAP